MREERVCSITPITDFENRVMEKFTLAKMAVLCAITGAFVSAIPVTTSAMDLGSDIEKALETVQNMIVKIAIPLYGLIAVICLIMIVASSGRKAEAAKDWLIRATIGVIAIGSIGVIIEFVKGLGKFS